MNRIIIERHLRDESMRPQLMKLLGDLRSAALHQPGYVSGESFINSEDGRDVIVLSTWINTMHWKSWETSETRKTITDLMAPLLDEDTKVKVCNFVQPEEIK